MTTTASSRPNIRARSNEAPATDDLIVGKRTAMASGLTVFAVGLAAAVAAAFGPTVFCLFAVTLPAPLILLWLSTDVVRSDERGAR